MRRAHVVVDAGTSLFKAGLEGEALPSVVMPPVVCVEWSSAGAWDLVGYRALRMPPSQWRSLAEGDTTLAFPVLMRHAVHALGCAVPSAAVTVATSYPLGDTDIAQALFEDVGVRAVRLVQSEDAAAAEAARQHGAPLRRAPHAVVDCGWFNTRVAVSSGGSRSVQAFNGAARVESLMAEVLQDKGVPQDAADVTLDSHVSAAAFRVGPLWSSSVLDLDWRQHLKASGWWHVPETVGAVRACAEDPASMLARLRGPPLDRVVELLQRDEAPDPSAGRFRVALTRAGWRHQSGPWDLRLCKGKRSQVLREASYPLWGAVEPSFRQYRVVPRGRPSPERGSVYEGLAVDDVVDWGVESVACVGNLLDEGPRGRTLVDALRELPEQCPVLVHGGYCATPGFLETLQRLTEPGPRVRLLRDPLFVTWRGAALLHRRFTTREEWDEFGSLQVF
eukprot:m51a1_g5398 hypothetical protein (448) ;mRNA; r:46441-47920